MNGLLVANDARDVPPCPVMAVAAPGEEGAMVVVLSEEVDIDQRCDAAGEEKEVFGEAGARVAGEVLQGLDGGGEGHKGIVKWDPWESFLGRCAGRAAHRDNSAGLKSDLRSGTEIHLISFDSKVTSGKWKSLRVC